ncbi:NYN domain-containing protein [Leptolyngbya sp. FACHB-261]|uniref:NYN domain-containing protein n=1 Tax=Leptolyngbya sp. FACHB-261 TaxID=2692806 RepID=UPI0016872732|nr:NYN domain-containing protein [Leptolyngbya sp. FACHB-261]MBD2102369.1 NYN domain-containing protein [Leptolyngbya sp. FACHB-261]
MSPPPKFEALLLVDGYNIIGAWPSLQAEMQAGGLEAARRGLVEALAGYSAYKAFNTHVIFDSQFQDNRRSREVVTPHVEVCYTDYRETADTFIERTCAHFRNDLRKFSQRLIVATSDRAQQLTVTGFGAEWLSARRLEEEVNYSQAGVRSRQRTPRKAQGSLASSLNESARQRLSRLRFGID